MDQHAGAAVGQSGGTARSSRGGTALSDETVAQIAAEADRLMLAADQPDPADPAEDEPIDLLEVVELLRTELDALRLPLQVPGAVAARQDRDQLIDQLDDYLLPRLHQIDAPVLAVVGGSTGAGKSLLVNSLVRADVSRSGVLRPTTRSPVLVHHPDDAPAFGSSRILPRLTRVGPQAVEPVRPIDAGPASAPVPALRLVPHPSLPVGIAIIDAPDIDSLVVTNRDLARQLLGAADLWLFVTSAARYADALPWQLLRQAVDRGVSVAIVLDRVPPEALQEVRAHLATMLRERGLATAPMFTIPETERAQDGFLPTAHVAPLLRWLTGIGRDARSRDVVIRRTLVGALDSLCERVPRVAAAADEQVAADERLRDELDEVYAAAAGDLEQRLCDATMLRGEVLVRWQEFVGSGAVYRTLESGGSKLRDRLAALGGADPATTTQLAQAVRVGAAALVRAAAQDAADQARQRWREHPEGAALLDAALTAGRAQHHSDQSDGDESHGDRPDARSDARPDPQRAAAESDSRLIRAIGDWQGAVRGLVRSVGVGPKPGGRTARPGGDGIDGAAAIVTFAVFNDQVGTGGDQREDVDAEAMLIPRRVLHALYGAQTAATLTARARADLLTRVGTILEGERSRVEALLDAADVRDGRGETLRAIAVAIEEAR